MNSTLLRTFLFAAALLVSLAYQAGCAHEVSHSESDKPSWFGGRTQEETTVYQNADGTTSTVQSKETTK